MLTPSFNITQNDNFIFVEIKAPYTKVSEAEIVFAEKEFRFYSKPYFLRLNFPGLVIENGEEKATYDADKGTFVITVPKLQHGQYFEGLDLQTKLLLPEKNRNTGPLIEVLGEETDILDDEEISWEIYQNPYVEPECSDLLITNAKYGFANQKSGVFTRIQNEIPDLIDVSNPDQKSFTVRKEEKFLREKDDFNDDHYLADLYQDEEIERLMAFEPKWKTSQMKDQINKEDLVVFTECEKERMRKLPRKNYLLDKEAKQDALLGLVDIIFAYAYNSRTTEEDNTVESAWTITKLSSTLSWLDKHSNMHSVVLSFLRRSLCYPLHRNWKLGQCILKDVIEIFSLGTKFVLKCLLEIYSCFIESEPHYILNDLYITDYCVWIQTIKSSTFIKISDSLKLVTITKNDVDFDIIDLEKAAKEALQENGPISQESFSINDLTEQLSALYVEEHSQTPNDSGSKPVCSSSENSDEETTDSDDYSNSSDVGETDSDINSNEESTSTDSSSDSENGLLLSKDKSIEKLR